jgi:hypothetical protein
MHKTNLLNASRIFPAFAAALALFGLTGCETMKLSNLTPDNVPQNPSQIYTVTLNTKAMTSNVVPESVQARIVIDGQNYPMTRSSSALDVWEFDYQLPAGRRGASYYFICEYNVKSGQAQVPREAYSDLQTMAITDRYVIRPEAQRAPAGAKISILGAGFNPQDVVYFGLAPVRTVFESSSSLAFFVPAVETGQSYRLRVVGPAGELAAGNFRVDVGNVSVSPGSLVLRPNEQVALTFNLPTPAPAGGMLIEVTTDIPASIVMPEVMVPPGQSHATVMVTGGKPGTGSLYFKSSAGEISIPVTVGN